MLARVSWPRRWWSWVSSVGVVPSHYVEARAVAGGNNFYVLASLGSLPWALILILHPGSPSVLAGFTQLAMIGVWCGGLVFNYFHRYIVAAILALSAPILQFTFLADIFSRDAGFHLPLLAVSAVGFVIFVPKDWFYRLFFTVIGTATLMWTYLDPRFSSPVPAATEAWVVSAALSNVALMAVFVYVLASFHTYYFLRERARNETLLGEARVAAQTDSLTSLLNRRGIAPFLSRVALEGDYALALADLDRFKRINDRLGHGAGDVVLANVARTLVHAVGPRGKVARWGGEEFLIAIPDVTLERAMQLMEKVRRVVEEEYGADGVLEHVTMSVGVAHARQGVSKDEVLRVADGKLYEAKASGRNVVIGAAVSEPQAGSRRSPRASS